MPSIGDRILQVRKKLNLTQNQLAGQLGISQQHISHIEKGTKEPSELLIKHFCLLYGTSEEWLTTGEGEMFLSPEEVIRSQVDRLGKEAVIEAVRKVIGSSPEQTTAQQSRDHDLEKMILLLEQLWQMGDDMQAWTRIQFARFFPDDIELQIEKKQEASILPALIHNSITKNY